jgi:hypothetical protein
VRAYISYRRRLKRYGDVGGLIEEKRQPALNLDDRHHPSGA